MFNVIFHVRLAREVVWQLIVFSVLRMPIEILLYQRVHVQLAFMKLTLDIVLPVIIVAALVLVRLVLTVHFVFQLRHLLDRIWLFLLQAARNFYIFIHF